MAATELTVQTMTSAGLEATFTAANADGNFLKIMEGLLFG